MAYITHICLRTGGSRRSNRADVENVDLDRLLPWLLVAIAQQVALPLPGDLDCDATAQIEDGGLIVSIYDRSPTAIMLLQIRVATRSRHGRVWPSQFGTALKPPAPWCCVVKPLNLCDQKPPEDVLLKLENAIAWAWMELRGT